MQALKLQAYSCFLMFDFSDQVSIADVALLLPLSVLTVVSNSLVIVTIWKDPLNNLKAIPNYLILNLAVSDLLVGIPGELLIALQYWFPYESILRASDMAVNLGFSSSGLTILGLAVERLIVISFPLKSADYLTYTSLTLGFLCIWLFAGLMTFLPELQWDSIFRNRVVITDAVCIPSFFIICSCYARMFFLVRKGCYRNLTTEAGFEERQSLTENAREMEKIKRRERSVMRCVAILIGLLMVCWTPYKVLVNMVQFCGKRCVITDEFEFIAYSLRFLYSLINPIVYALCTRKFRRALWKIICTCKCARPR